MHGYLSNGKSFNNQRAFLERDFEVFAPDLKGFGDNQRMEYPYSLDDYIKEVKEYCYKNRIVRPFVVAHSFGGRIALKTTAQDQNFCEKLVLTGCAGLKPRASLKKILKKTTFNLLKKFTPREKLVKFYSPDYIGLSPVMKESFKLIVGEYLDEYLQKIAVPTLIIAGEKDGETPLYTAKRLHKGIKESSLSVYADAGHFCFIDKPLKFNLEVREFFLS
ncbi:MAG: alpha/beta hydrolase [Clostridia bacterium]|nr:alpha/beta hydrolase [Clostridia bacterium]